MGFCIFSTREWVALGFAFVLLAVGSTMTLNRKSGFDVRLRSYSEVYNMNDSPRIAGFSVLDSGKMRLDIPNVQSRSWEIWVDGDRSHTIESPKLSIDLVSGYKNYTVKPEGEQPFDLNIAWKPGKERALVTDASIPIRANLPYSLDDFVISIDDIPEDKVRRAERILRDAGIKDEDSDEQKIEKLSLYLHHTLHEHRGGPEPYMRRLDGLSQFEEALAGNSKVFCTNFSEIYAFLATVAGVPTRVVNVGGAFDNVKLGAHAFAESYLPDKSQWVYVDVELSLAFVQDASGRFLNGANILQRNDFRASDGLTAFVLGGNSVTKRPYAEAMPDIRKYVSGEHTLMYLWGSSNRYSTSERLLRLFLNPQPGYSLEKSGTDALTRLVCTYVGLAIVFSLLAYRGYGFFWRKS